MSMPLIVFFMTIPFDYWPPANVYLPLLALEFDPPPLLDPLLGVLAPELLGLGAELFTPDDPLGLLLMELLFLGCELFS